MRHSFHTMSHSKNVLFNVCVKQKVTDWNNIRVNKSYSCFSLSPLFAVLDVNDETPTFFPSVYNISLEESVPRDYVLVRLNCSDNDAGLNAELSYFITGQVLCIWLVILWSQLGNEVDRLLDSIIMCVCVSQQTGIKTVSSALVFGPAWSEPWWVWIGRRRPRTDSWLKRSVSWKHVCMHTYDLLQLPVWMTLTLKCEALWFPVRFVKHSEMLVCWWQFNKSKLKNIAGTV